MATAFYFFNNVGTRSYTSSLYATLKSATNNDLLSKIKNRKLWLKKRGNITYKSGGNTLFFYAIELVL